MRIETERLLLFPLTGDQLRLLIYDIEEFEKQTAYCYDGESLEGEMYDIFKGQIDPVLESRADFIWRTFWMMVLKNEDTIIGSVCFKDIPSSDGSVEIGYGVSPRYESLGYTTEAVGAMIHWALKQPDVLQVIAEVDKDNIASQRILHKNSLRKYKSVDNFDWYSTNY